MTREEHATAIQAAFDAAAADGCYLDFEVSGCCGKVESVTLDQYFEGKFHGFSEISVREV